MLFLLTIFLTSLTSAQSVSLGNSFINLPVGDNSAVQLEGKVPVIGSIGGYARITKTHSSDGGLINVVKDDDGNVISGDKSGPTVEVDNFYDAGFTLNTGQFDQTNAYIKIGYAEFQIDSNDDFSAAIYGVGFRGGPFSIEIQRVDDNRIDEIVSLSLGFTF